MQQDYTQETSFIRAKKRVKAIKGFYVHFLVYILANIFISGVIIFGLTKSGDNIEDAFSNFGVYSTWVFWGIGMFFHWLGVFGFKPLGFGNDWEEKKIKELMEKEDLKKSKFYSDGK
ncbi:2TM domain-containing protein [Polaribacter sp. IC073]|uniref:2TM domain-containing protein n=1 Tax=Polaribacter sp. IC073 TaxID=2508540 RepID=UPI0011BF9E62|nr:2TM domain-containing protein [Polaribacter sp. IC073]TXD47115.1 2TM domain-containing protein [Polaribacter sp. IC073]